MYKKSCFEVQESLKDDFNTPAALQSLQSLMKYSNIRFRNESKIPGSLLIHVSSFIEKILTQVFGLQTIHLENSQVSKSADNSSISTDTNHIIDQLVDCRLELRKIGLDTEFSDSISKEVKGKLLKLSDKIRDQLLDDKIEIKDRQLEASSWRIMNDAEYEHHKNQSVVSKTKLQNHHEELMKNPPESPDQLLERWKKEFLQVDQDVSKIVKQIIVS